MSRQWAASILLAAAAAVAPGRSAADEPAGPEACVDRFAAALEAGNRQAALAELAPDVLIFEEGGAEVSREEYASHHLDADMKFLGATETRRLERRGGGTAEAAWVLTLSETTGTFNGKPIASRGAETMLLERFPAGWRIIHIHWSSRAKP